MRKTVFRLLALVLGLLAFVVTILAVCKHDLEMSCTSIALCVLFLGYFFFPDLVARIVADEDKAKPSGKKDEPH